MWKLAGHTLGYVSGAHVNPAVTVGLVVGGFLGPLKALLYVTAQCVGATAGSFVLQALTPNETVATLGVNALNRHVTPTQGCFVEMVISFVLVMAVYSAATGGAAAAAAGPFTVASLTKQEWDQVDGASWSQAECIRKKSTACQPAKFEHLNYKEHQNEDMCMVINMSDKQLDEATLKVLRKGLNFAVTPRNVPVTAFISAVGQANNTPPSSMAEEICREMYRALTNTKPQHLKR
ncbi:aquaporin NIP1-4-like [Schistocerca piceifrons]|uniref:aquaporin NIP1-4-like n=1 Tax=Schistocerca piceifrons TaxID=274613 RepID=UPI001F5F0327|nr:aquaporin NIP1-4-like [Schistocerca piceifrons]